MATVLPYSRRIKPSPIKFDTIELAGGLDQLTPRLKLKPGVAIESVNFECSPNGGYTRIGGYERFDGRAKPSAANYALVQVESFVSTPTVGQTLTGATSGATGTIIALGSNYLVLTLIAGTFTTSEVVRVGAATIGTATTQTVTISSQLNAQYLNLAADVYRALVAAVPGSGPVRGVFNSVINGVRKVFAFRDNAGATSCLLYVASTSGWTVVPFFYEVAFQHGNGAIPTEGATLTQGANSAVLKRVVTESGDWDAGTAAGRFIVDAPTPGSFSAAALTTGATADLLGAQTAITFSVGGKFEFDHGNFEGQLATRRVYGCDRVNRGFEFDGTILVPIRTGALTDTPTHVRVHSSHLMLFIGSSVMISGDGFPYRYTAADGAAEIAVGDLVTGSLVQPGNQDSAALAIWSRNLSHMLYGTDAATWKLVTFASSTGAFEYMMQNLDRSYLLDDQGVMSLQTAQEFGNFRQATLTQNIQTFIGEKRSLSAYSCVNHDRSQFRLFFSDGSGLYVTIVNGKLLGSMPVLFPTSVYCAWSGENASGDEETYWGSASGGFVYELDKGSSFDGAAIDARVTLNWNHQGSPRIRKRYRRASFEMQGNFYASVSVGYALGYGSPKISQPGNRTYESAFTGLQNWDAVSWDSFQWDGQTTAPTEIELTGRAENIQYTIQSSSDYLYPFTVSTVTTHYSLGRALK